MTKESIVQAVSEAFYEHTDHNPGGSIQDLARVMFFAGRTHAIEECVRAAKKCRAEIDYYDPPSADRVCEEIIEAIEKSRTTTEVKK